VKVKHLIDSRNRQAENALSVTIRRRKSRIRHCWSKWLLEINTQIYDLMLVVQTETIALF